MKTAIFVFFASALWAQNTPPPLVNARLETRALSGSLKSAFTSVTGPAWIGYAVPSANESEEGCCYDASGSRSCPLEENRHPASKRVQSTPIALETSRLVAILFRVQNHTPGKIRAYSLSCTLDAGGLPFIWLTGVSVEESLLNLAQSARAEPPVKDAVFAIAQHADPKATGLLVEFTRTNHPEQVRDQAIFWLGATGGSAALPVLKDLAAHDPNERIRDKAIFALSTNKQPEALDALIDTARHDDSAHARGQALFWLAQKAGARSTATITEAVLNDPDAEVKKQAVFALSQLPKEQAVPKLIEIARSQKNAEVRKQAFFWLGQTNDPRALAFIEQVLNGQP